MDKKQEYSCNSGTSDDEAIARKRKKHEKKSKKSKHKSKKQKKSRNKSDSDKSDDVWVEKVDKRDKSERDWMISNDFHLSTFTKEKKELNSKKEVARRNDSIYDPATSSRELNPYFKTGEGGFPSKSNFQRPKDDDDSVDMCKKSCSVVSTASIKSNWKKQAPETETIAAFEEMKDPYSVLPEKKPSSLDHSDYMSDVQMNKLGARLLKAELSGNTQLTEELKIKLEKAREYKRNNKDSVAENAVVLSISTPSGMQRPVEEKYGEHHYRQYEKKKPKRSSTHEGGERLKYYPDDGKYDIKQMFEKEKFSDGRDQDLEFAKVIGNIKESSQMDMDEIFSDEIRKNTQKKSNDYNSAVRETEKMKKTLDNCYKCFDSPKMNKPLVIYVGKTIYLSIPHHEALVPHHLIICPIQHVPSLTMIDEEVWHEFISLKKALTRFFSAQGEDVIFFETVKYLNRQPHMEVQFMSSKEFEMIQFYFKKAIQESESSVNKKLIEIKNEKSVRSRIPTQLPYFYCDFGHMGMAHVIENQEKFPSNFAQEIIGGMLNLDVSRWRKPRKELQPDKRVNYFSGLFKDLFEILK